LGRGELNEKSYQGKFQKEFLAHLKQILVFKEKTCITKGCSQVFEV